MNRTVIIDTNAIYALTTQPDRNYPQATRFWEAWLQSGGRAILTDSVFAESMTLLKARHGAGVAIAAGRKLRNSRAYHWIPLTPGDEVETWAVFQQYADKEWSYVDCGLFALARRLARPVFSFDRHFDQMPEIKRVP